MSIVPDNETDAEFLARLDWMDAACKARLEATYPAEPLPEPYEPTPADWAEYRRWSEEETRQQWLANVQEHSIALQVWMDFYGDDDCKSTYYVD